MGWAAIAQIAGGVLYAIAMGVASGAIPVGHSPWAAVALAAAGAIARTFTNSNAVVPGAAPVVGPVVGK